MFVQHSSILGGTSNPRNPCSCTSARDLLNANLFGRDGMILIHTSFFLVSCTYLRKLIIKGLKFILKCSVLYRGMWNCGNAECDIAVSRSAERRCAPAVSSVTVSQSVELRYYLMSIAVIRDID